MMHPLHWSDDQLKTGLEKAKFLFREERLREPLEAYTEAFDKYRINVENLLEATSGLTNLEQKTLEVLTNDAFLDVFRYLAGPPISKDDLIVLAEARLTASRLRAEPAMVSRVFKVVRASLDRRRFPWVDQGHDPTEAEKNTAIVASAALLAASRVGTSRRNEGKERQELSVCNALLGRSWVQVPPRTVATFNQAPGVGEFCRESMLGNAKADLLVGLRDRRIMAIECKVSNSATNSVKRLNREAAGKAEKWIHDFGALNVVPTAILSGVYKLGNLKSAQERGITIFWAHDLVQLLNWIEAPQ